MMIFRSNGNYNLHHQLHNYDKTISKEKQFDHERLEYFNLYEQ